MLKFTGDSPEMTAALQEALDTMLSVLTYLNDSMHQVSITGYSVSENTCGLYNSETKTRKWWLIGKYITQKDNGPPSQLNSLWLVPTYVCLFPVFQSPLRFLLSISKYELPKKKSWEYEQGNNNVSYFKKKKAIQDTTISNDYYSKGRSPFFILGWDIENWISTCIGFVCLL